MLGLLRLSAPIGGIAAHVELLSLLKLGHFVEVERLHVEELALSLAKILLQFVGQK